MIFSILREGQIKKHAKYCPNPVVKFGIPSWADTKANPKVVDTLAYHQYWEEQIYYIKNGYTSGGLWVPGRYYKFVNFDPAQTVKGVGTMELHDYQLDYAYWIEHLKSPGIRKNAFVPKARRKALSVMTVGMVVDYGWRFSDHYHAAVVAGLDEYSQDFIAKWKFLNMNVRNEFKIKTLRINDDEIVAGWKEQTEEGWVEAGTQNTIYIRTVNNNPNVLKGKFLNDIIYEESGENPLLLETIAASEDCLRSGGVQYGTSFIYGTGGNMSVGSKGFKEIHMHLNAYNCEQLYIPGYVFYEPAYAGAVDENGNLVEQIPNLKQMKKHERVGWSDFEHAKSLINEKKRILLAEGDMEKYVKFCQNNPITIDEIFRRSTANNFDMIKLNDQVYKVESEDKKYNRFKLEWEKDIKTGETIIPYKTILTPATKDTPEDQCVYILNAGHPVPGYRFLDVAGIDSYDQNQAKESKSLGAMVVFRRKHNIPDMPDWCPVALIRNRPKYKEQFYNLCMMLSVHYDLQASVLVDIGAGMVIKHFEDNGCGRYLSGRPRKFESPNTQQTHNYGVSINAYSKPKMVAALQTLFDFHVEKIWFEHILAEALNYDEFEIGSDNDTVDALGIALMKAIDMDAMPMNEDEEEAEDPWVYPEYGENSQGDIYDRTRFMNKKQVDGVDTKKKKDKPQEDYVSRFHRLGADANGMMSESSEEDPLGNW